MSYMHSMCMLQDACGSQDSFQSWSSLYSVWDSEIKLKLLDLVDSTFTCRAIFLVQLEESYSEFSQQAAEGNTILQKWLILPEHLVYTK